jgi:hypothetical protein
MEALRRSLDGKPASKPTVPVREVPRAAARKRMAREEPVARMSVEKARGA